MAYEFSEVRWGPVFGVSERPSTAACSRLPGSISAIVEIRPDRTVVLADRKDATSPRNAKRSSVKKMLMWRQRTSMSYGHYGRRCMNTARVATTDAEIDAAIARAGRQDDGLLIEDASYNRGSTRWCCAFAMGGACSFRGRTWRDCAVHRRQRWHAWRCLRELACIGKSWMWTSMARRCWRASMAASDG